MNKSLKNRIFHLFLKQIVDPEDIEVAPKDIPCDFLIKSTYYIFLTNSQTGILLCPKYIQNYESNELNFYGKFREEALKAKVAKAIVIRQDIIPYLLVEDPEVTFKKLEEYGIYLVSYLFRTSKE